MAARSPRRSFANPFVVTLAVLPAAIPACVAAPDAQYPQPPPQQQQQHVAHGDTSQPPRQPPPRQPDSPAPVISNPPRPMPPAPPAPAPVTPTSPTVGSKAGGGASTGGGTTTAQPVDQKPPATYSYDQRWTISKSGDGCFAYAKVECPKPTKPGGPVATCNPPPPIKYSCLDGMTAGASVNVVQYRNTSECVVETEPVKCPPNTMCNPPRPRPVACPKY